MGLLTTWSEQARAASYSGIVMDAKTGKVLYSHRADARAYPASLTKMMTLYMLFEAMDAGKLSKSSRITVSSHAASMPPTKLGVKPGGSVSVNDAVLALVTRSANDIAAAIGEELGGTESQFAAMMTRKARQLGMSQTTFRNASGLPNSSQVSTARDMAILGVALREHFPQYYDYFSVRSFRYNKRNIGNHNRLLGRVKGVDGIKTGYTRASGFNLVSSVQRDGRSIVAVVMGGRSGASRNAQMEKLIASYLPKASRGQDRMLVARAGNSFSSGGAAVVASLPKDGPPPVYSATYRLADTDDPSERRILAAHTMTQNASAGSALFDTAAIARKLRELSGRRLPTPSPAPTAVQTLAQAPTPSQASTPDGTDSVRTAAVEPAKTLAFVSEESRPSPAAEAVEQQAPVKDGWQIQIGAVPSKSGAIALLEKARSRAPGLLNSVANYTEAVEKGNETLYRARFAGFASKSEAWGACGALKKKKFACLALAN